jgi:hypothetical protein
MILALSGCTSSPRQASLAVQSSPIPVVVPTRLIQPSKPPVATTLTLQPPKAVLTTDWSTFSWQGFTIPLPPNAQWQTLSTDTITAAVAPVSARGAVSSPLAQGVVELPYGPIFTLYVFSDSLEEWLKMRQQQNPASVDGATIRDTTLASLPAKGYQPVVTGLCNAGLYITKTDATHLLEIYTECIDSGVYPSVISQLRFQTP